MPTAKNSRITLELEADANPIRGRIEHPDGSCQPFWGWLELIEDLGRAAAAEPKRPTGATLANTGSSFEPAARAKRRKPNTTTEEQP